MPQKTYLDMAPEVAATFDNDLWETKTDCQKAFEEWAKNPDWHKNRAHWIAFAAGYFAAWKARDEQA